MVMLSFDTEQIWGYLDQLNEPQIQSRYPGAIFEEYPERKAGWRPGKSRTDSQYEARLGLSWAA